ncbi:hypothetical protein ACMYR2_3213 [Nitrobacter sp. TKz-YC01]
MKIMDVRTTLASTHRIDAMGHRPLPVVQHLEPEGALC